MTRAQINVVNLSKEEREELLSITAHRARSAQEIRRAHILLLTDRSLGVCREDQEIASFLNVTPMTVINTRRKFCQNGLKSIHHKKGGGRPRFINGEVEAHIVATACSHPPEGKKCWTLELIANRVIALKELDSLSRQSVYRTLKKTKRSLGSRKSGKFPLEKTPNLSTAWRES